MENDSLIREAQNWLNSEPETVDAMCNLVQASQYMQRLIDALKAATRPDNWRDIKDAPDNGIILVWSDLMQRPYIGIYDHETKTIIKPHITRGYKFTHWQPLPAPPQGDKDGG